MSVRTFALIFGLLFAATGIAGFISGLVTPHDAVEHQLAIEQGAGNLLGLFPTNVLHDIVHLAFGVLGLAVFRSTAASIGYARSVAVVYAVLVVMGLIPGLDTVMDRCVKIEHARLFGGLHWAGVNTRVISARRPV